MYYSNGNYEAFARPKKPEGVDNKSAYIIGSGLAALTTRKLRLAAAGICGVKLRPNALNLATRINSAPARKKPTG